MLSMPMLSMGVLGLVNMDVEISADDDGASISRKLLEHRRQLLKEGRSRCLTARSVNA